MLQTLITARRVKRLVTVEATSSITLPALRPSDLSAHIQLAERAIPSSLNMVEFALMIACKHLTEEEKPVNFVIAYERYVDHCKRAAASGSSSSRAFSRGLCLRVSIKVLTCHCRASNQLFAGFRIPQEARSSQGSGSSWQAATRRRKYLQAMSISAMAFHDRRSSQD